MATILLILQLLPTILAAIVAIENVFKGITAGGALKKQVVLDSLAGQDPKIVSVTSTLIDRSVASFNKAGVFTHGTGVVDVVSAPMEQPQINIHAQTAMQENPSPIGPPVTTRT